VIDLNDEQFHTRELTEIAFKNILEALRTIPVETRERVLRAAAAFLNIKL